jgi:hypothetical protein
MQHLPYEISKKLVEKGFDGKTSTVYKRNVLACRYEDCPCPTISQALTWLREVHDIVITVEPIDRMTIFMSGERYQLNVFINSRRVYEVHRHYTDKYVTWEDAAIGGIVYALDNLIII